MYESPITMYMSEIQQQIEEQQEEQLILTVNKSIGYDVDKQELIKALQYDREQYSKGYGDCKSDMLDKVKQAREEIDDLDRYFDNDYFSSNSDAMFKCNEVLEILDELIAESEE